MHVFSGYILIISVMFSAAMGIYFSLKTIRLI